MVTTKDESMDLQSWYLDIEATCHTTLQGDWFILYKNLNPPLIIYIGDDAGYKAIGIDIVQIKFKNDDVAKVQDVLHISNLAKIYFLYVKPLFNVRVLNFVMFIAIFR